MLWQGDADKSRGKQIPFTPCQKKNAQRFSSYQRCHFHLAVLKKKRAIGDVFDSHCDGGRLTGSDGMKANNIHQPKEGFRKNSASTERDCYIKNHFCGTEHGKMSLMTKKISMEFPIFCTIFKYKRSQRMEVNQSDSFEMLHNSYTKCYY